MYRISKLPFILSYACKEKGSESPARLLETLNALTVFLQRDQAFQYVSFYTMLFIAVFLSQH